MALDTPATSLAARDPLDLSTSRDAALAARSTVRKVKSPNLVVLGGANRDVNLRVRALPLAGETVAAEKAVIYHGGKGANQAVQAALLMRRDCGDPAVNDEASKKKHLTQTGGKVALICKLGDDDTGEAYRRYLEGVGIDMTGVLTAQGEPTGCAYVTVAEDAENTIVFDPGANACLTAEDIRNPRITELIQNAKIFVCENGIRPDVVVTALKLAKSSPEKVLTVFTPAPVASVPLEAFAYADYVVVNENEARQMYNLAPVTKTQDSAGNVFEERESSDDEWPSLGAGGASASVFPSPAALRAKLIQLGQKATTVQGPESGAGSESGEQTRVSGERIRAECNVIVTQGKDGCTVIRQKESGHRRVSIQHLEQKRRVPPEQVVDTVGAGDAFCGALAYFLGEEELSVNEAIEKAGIVASFSVQKRGANESYAGRETLRGTVF
ncbi:putative ribokinase [Neospora caninum Liverpool]|uniref:Ribokinase n=1 Tax=Neospora caninum (strain Liverpool) TaxID=572307 RepID=F0V7E7_NEOCL|nr:putative ribokinase [Neospora caninum Liverpool]CBZ49638.1 putative ribokinase [Neospora caninum Liverpool]CEL64221.1 TPA: ribokinase, putative [Neospora caninum Liverpool]|eukprot:XP_003879673.1 putative ribokinase [Neospora caninum Liverpool]